jgi:hypothetical protein
MKLFWIGVFLLSFGQLSTIAQAPALEIFTSPDGTFRFVYPQNYQLVVGESILRATQGRHQSLPVCDFATALACVIYPIETGDETRFEGGGFSVNTISGVSGESDCLSYSDQPARVQGEPLQLSSISIHDRVFRHASLRKKIPGHSQAADLYRTFLQKKCYELQVMVSLADGISLQRVVRTGSLGDATADSARESLELILSSFAFNE